MALFRIVILLLLLAAGACFAVYAVTGRARYKRLGIVILKWTLIGAFGFFAVLAVQRFG
ncbi:hypothetical protein [Ramlibacter rhizophilus]|uniref:hypothetical protein n=1 Tax=Ramlibacter rhizophilus TaxID=1781167 RepID=UPI001432366E|nr:hypothetical protein [Ramlibacter rhizophilus]